MITRETCISMMERQQQIDSIAALKFLGENEEYEKFFDYIQQKITEHLVKGTCTIEYGVPYYDIDGVGIRLYTVNALLRQLGFEVKQVLGTTINGVIVINW